MKIQDTVYIVGQSLLFGMPIKNSASIYKGEVVAMKADTATVKVEIDVNPTSYVIQEIENNILYATPQQAFEQANKLVITKDISYESANQQQG